MDKLAKTCARVCYYTYHPDQATDIGEWRVHSKSDRIVVYINKITFAVIIGVRGSKDMDDIKTDVRLLAGSQTISDTQPYLRLKSVLANLSIVPADSKIVLTGHSLGGLVCLYEFLQFRLKNINQSLRVYSPSPLLSTRPDYYGYFQLAWALPFTTPSVCRPQHIDATATSTATAPRQSIKHTNRFPAYRGPHCSV